MKLLNKVKNIILTHYTFNYFVKFYIDVIKHLTKFSFILKKFLIKLSPLLKNLNKFPLKISYSKIWFNNNSQNFNSSYREIHPSEIIKRKKPKTLEDNIHWKFQKEFSRKMSTTFILKIENGRVWGENAAIITPDATLLSDVSKLGSRPNEHKIFRKIILPKILKSKYTVGVVATDGGSSYFHWIFDVLPRIKLLTDSNFEIDKYLINYSNKSFQNQTLQILNINLNKIIPSSDNLYLQAYNLIIPSLVNDASGHIPKWACEFLRERFLKQVKNNNTKYEYIYISRQKAIGRKVINEGEVIRFLSHYNFKKVLLEDFTFKKQIEIFNSAKVIIAPHGAGLTNLVFCKPNSKVIELFSPKYINPCYYSLSNLINLDYYYLLGEGKKYRDGIEPFGIRNNIWINIIKLKKLLNLAEI